MADYTENYKLEKPREDENYSVEVFNKNADIIDRILKELQRSIDNKTIDVDDELSEESSNPVENKVITAMINELKKSWSDDKTGVADAITAKGVETATDSDFDTIISNIGKIITLSEGTADATALAKYIVQGKTAYTKGEKLTGTLPNRSHVSHGAEGVVGLNSEKHVNVAVSPYDGAKHWMTNTDGVTRLCLQAPYGVYGGAGNPGGLSGDGYVGIEVEAFGDAEASDVVAGKTFTSKNGIKIKGTMEGFFANKNEAISIMPYSGYSSKIVVLNNEIHALGFCGSGTMVGETAHYKWNGTEWTSVSTLPYGDLHFRAVVLNGEIHILGGANGAGNYSHYKWNGTGWTSVSTLPFSFISGCAVVLDGEIHILGSIGSEEHTYHYKWNGEKWTSVSTLPYNPANGCAVVLNGEIHIFGGGGSSATVSYHYKWNGAGWTSVSTMPCLIYDFDAAVLDGSIFAIGGTDGSTTYDNIWQWNGTEWIDAGTIPKASYCHGNNVAVLVEGIHYFGGRNLSNIYDSHYIVVEKNYRKVV